MSSTEKTVRRAFLRLNPYNFIKFIGETVDIRFRYKGSSRSGNYMHSGRPGKVGGSTTRSFAYPMSANPTDLDPKDIKIAGKSGAEWIQTSADYSATKTEILRAGLKGENVDPDATDKYIERLNQHRAMVMEETLRVSQHYDLTPEEQAELMNDVVKHDTLDKYGVRTAVPYIDKIATGGVKGGESKAFWKVCNEHHDNNPHHPEYWAEGDRAPQMPTTAMIQMAGDWIATAKFFKTPVDGYYRKYGGTEFVLHPNTRAAAERELGITTTPFPERFPKDYFGQPATQAPSKPVGRGENVLQPKLFRGVDISPHTSRLRSHKEYKAGKLPKFGIDAVLLAGTEGGQPVATKAMIIVKVKGSSKSGNYGHSGRPGKVGGSRPKSGPITITVVPKTKTTFANTTTSDNAEDVYDKSSKDIQELADKTGFIAMDAEALDYIKNNMDKFKFTEDDRFPDEFRYAMEEARLTDWDVLHDVDKATKNVWDTTAMLNRIVTERLISGKDDELRKGVIASVLSAGEQAKADAIKNAGGDISKVTYPNIRSPGNPFTGKEALRNWNDDATHAAFKNLSDNDKASIVDLSARIAVAKWVSYGVSGTVTRSQGKPEYQMFGGSVVMRPGDELLTGLGKDTNWLELAWNYRNKMLQTPEKAKTLAELRHDKSRMTGLSSMPKDSKQKALDGITATWDKKTHNDFTHQVNGVFAMRPPRAMSEAYAKVATTKDNEMEAYHGTHYKAARGISGTGYRVPKESREKKAGSMMGNGVYMAANSSKSIQYVGDNFGHGSESGVLMINKVARGKEARYQPNSDVQSPKADTIYGKAGQSIPGGYKLANDEWCIKDAAAVLPTIWIDVTRIPTGDNL